MSARNALMLFIPYFYSNKNLFHFIATTKYIEQVDFNVFRYMSDICVYCLRSSNFCEIFIDVYFYLYKQVVEIILAHKLCYNTNVSLFLYIYRLLHDVQNKIKLQQSLWDFVIENASNCTLWCFVVNWCTSVIRIIVYNCMLQVQFRRNNIEALFTWMRIQTQNKI